MGKIIEVYPRAGKTPHTAPVWQYDYGQIIHINGINLPASYKAEFSNTTRGDAISTVQTTDEITIPAQFIESGAAVYIWLVIVDETSRTTEYALIVPVAARAKPTDEEPTPEEQTEIEQTLSALNQAVSDVQGIADTIPDTINEALEAAKESGEFDGADGKDGQDGKDGADGYTPQKGIDYFDGEDGKDGKDGKDGADGQTGPAGKDGAPGTPGADGTTFTPAVSAEGVISWTNNGGKTNPQPVNIKGLKGDDGTSPTVSVADITGGHGVTVTDANGTRSFDVMDGEDYVLTAADKAEIAQQAAENVDVPVQDVQVNGVSVLTDGVANVPIASSSGPGVVAIGGGLQVVNDVLTINRATNSLVKAGTNQTYPLVPYTSSLASFYGLAKAAGADMASSSNPVGTYTNEAKIAIQKMLGTYEAPWELIREDTFTNATSADHVVNTDANGQSFELVEAIILFETPTQDTESSIGSSGGLKFGYTTHASVVSKYATKIEIGSWTQAANALAHGGAGVFKQDNGLVQIYRAGSATPSNTGTIGMRYGEGFPNLGASDRVCFAIVSETWYVNSITIMTVTGTGHYKLFGRRKWQ